MCCIPLFSPPILFSLLLFLFLPTFINFADPASKPENFHVFATQGLIMQLRTTKSEIPSHHQVTKWTLDFGGTSSWEST